MLAQLTDLFELRARPATQAGRPTSTLAFDWLYTLLMLLFTVGFMLDVWSHSTFGPDQSVLSEYHLMFYSSVALMGLFLLGAQMRNVNAGCRFEQALPLGYGFALFGVIGFATAGSFDLVGHALFGFENNEEALLSPTHLGMFVTWGALGSGPLLARIARFRAKGQQNLWRSLPAIISTVAVLIPFSLMLLNVALPLGGNFMVAQSARGWSGGGFLWLATTLSGFFVQTAFFFGVVLWMIRSARWPIGTFVLIFALFGATIGLPFFASDIFAIFGGLMGLALEVVYHLLRPDATKVWEFRAFGFIAPVVFWLAYFGYILATDLQGGIGMTGYMWLGIVFQMGLVGFAIASLLTLQPAQPLTHKEQSANA